MPHGQLQSRTSTSTLPGMEVRRLRETVHLSQAQLALRVGYTRQYVWQLEHERRPLTRRLYDVILCAVEHEQQALDQLHQRRAHSLAVAS